MKQSADKQTATWFRAAEAAVLGGVAVNTACYWHDHHDLGPRDPAGVRLFDPAKLGRFIVDRKLGRVPRRRAA